MIKNLNILIVLCIIGLILGVLFTLICAVKGLFAYMAVGGVVSMLLCAMLIVLFKERRMASILADDDYDDYDGCGGNTDF